MRAKHRNEKYTAAVVQAAPVFLDREATISKAESLIAEAAKNGAKVIAFPETWIPTYPVWILGRQVGVIHEPREPMRSSIEKPL